jgi:tetratricopeptide (TPR) repeat protein
MKTGICLLALILSWAVQADAQWAESGPGSLNRYGAEKGFLVRGMVSSDSTLTGALTVELLINGSSHSESTSLGGDGSFEFRSVQPGVYELQITGPDRSVLHREHVIISGPNQLLSINLPRRGSADRFADPTVSIRQLQHKVPAPAQKEFSKGQAAARKQDYQAALDHFQKAIDIDPEFADAYGNIGIAEAVLGRLEEAAEQLQKAVNLVPDHTLAISNLSIVLAQLKRYGDAGQAARQALKLNPSLLRMRYILAVSLTREPGHETEALDNLERAAVEIPKARLLAADILTGIGRREDAVKQLEHYLRALPEQDADRHTVEERLAQLRQP